MLFELITHSPLDERVLYDRSKVVAVSISSNRYFISNIEAEMSRDAAQLEMFLKQTLSSLKIAYVSLKLINAKRMVKRVVEIDPL